MFVVIRLVWATVAIWLFAAFVAQHAHAAPGHASVSSAQMADDTLPGIQAEATDCEEHAHAAFSGVEQGHHHGDDDPADTGCCLAGCNVGALIFDETIARPAPLGSVAIDCPEAVLLQFARSIGKPPKNLA